MEKKETRGLKKRYLIWLYKNAKEELDKIERKFTQVEVDRAVLKELKKADKDGSISAPVRQFEAYIEKKEEDGLNLKFDGEKLKPDYIFLVARLYAIKKSIIKELGKKGLEEIRLIYEKEMTARILRSTEH